MLPELLILEFGILKNQILDCLVSLVVIGQVVAMIEKVLPDMHSILVQVLYPGVQRIKILLPCHHLKQSILLSPHHLVKRFG